MMRKVILFFCMMPFFLEGYCQESNRYLVFIFNKKYRGENRLRGGTGSHLWIIPYDSCKNKIDVNQLKPFFATDDMKDEIEFNKNNGIGVLHQSLYDKSDSVACFLRKNKRMIQKTKTKSYFRNYNITLSVELVPIKAVCRNDLLGFYKKEIVVLEDSIQLWPEFWKEDEYIYRKLVSEDYLSFDFIVRLSMKPVIP